MGKLISEISMSVDGFITDPSASVGTRLEGNDPGRLHDWRFDAKTKTDDEIHVVPILLDGIRLFEELDPTGIELRKTSTIETPGATDLKIEVVK